MKTKGSMTNLTRKRIAILREMATLGICKTVAAEMTCVSPAAIWQICERHKIKMPEGKRGTKNDWLSRRILRDVNLTMSGNERAERYGTSRASVNSALHRLRKEGKLPPVQQRR